jgi:hypothetical protein
MTSCASDAASGGDGGDSSLQRPDMLLAGPKQHHSRGTKMFVPSQFPAGEALMQHVVYTFSKDPYQKIRYRSCQHSLFSATSTSSFLPFTTN